MKWRRTRRWAPSRRPPPSQPPQPPKIELQASFGPLQPLPQVARTPLMHRSGGRCCAIVIAAIHQRRAQSKPRRKTGPWTAKITFGAPPLSHCKRPWQSVAPCKKAPCGGVAWSSSQLSPTAQLFIPGEALRGSEMLSQR
jgi:hypothetical protein